MGKYKVQITNAKGEWVEKWILESISNSRELALDFIRHVKPTRPFGWCTDWIRLVEPKEENNE